MIEASGRRREVALTDASIQGLTFERAPEGMRGLGVVGFATCRFGELVVELVVRRTRDDRLLVSFPQRRSRSGQRFEVARPATHEGRRRIERDVIDALRARGDLP